MRQDLRARRRPAARERGGGLMASPRRPPPRADRRRRRADALALPPHAPDPALRGGGAFALPEGRGARHDAPLQRRGGLGHRRRQRARARTTAWPAPTAATGTRSRIGTSPQGLLDELLGRSTGVCGGRAGSMNVIDLEHGLIGCYGIVGGSISAALGRLAGAARARGNVAVAYFGDGATNQAYFHECLNFARVFSLPAVFVCENNLYGEFTPMEQVTAGEIRGARRRPRHRLRERRRHGRVGDARGRAARDRARPRRSRAGVPRDAGLPLRRPLAQRPGQATASRASSSAGRSAIRCCSAAGG